MFKSMIANILAIIFLLKLSSKTHLNASSTYSFAEKQKQFFILEYIRFSPVENWVLIKENHWVSHRESRPC